MAMNIISKEKKEIHWIGLPTNSVQECQELEKENRERRRRIEAKQQQLKQLILQQVAFTSLVNRNKDAEDNGLQPTASSAIQLPFIIVNTHKKTHINCSISNDKWVWWKLFFFNKFFLTNNFCVERSIHSNSMTNLRSMMMWMYSRKWGCWMVRIFLLHFFSYRLGEPICLNHGWLVKVLIFQHAFF